MGTSNNGEKDHVHETEFKRFAAKRIIFFTLIGVVAIWVVGVVIGHFEKPAGVQTAKKSESHVVHESSKNSPQPETLHEAIEKSPAHTLPEDKGHETTDSPKESEKDTAGDIMTTDFIALNKDLTAKEAVEFLKGTHQEIKQPTQMFVVDAHETLVGVITQNQLLFASAETILEDIVTTDIYTANIGLDMERVKALIDQHHLPSVPVIDKTNKLVGVVSANQVLHLAKQDVVKAPSHAPAPVHETPAPVHDAQAPTYETPAPAHDAQSPTHETPAPTHEAQAPTHETPAPAHETQAPTNETPAPAHETQAPTHKTPAPAHETQAPTHKAPAHGVQKAADTKPKAKGVAFVEATIAPLDYELNERFWGWRSNDILDFTDNINSFQLGVLEVTRRTVVALTERISRTGATAAFDENLESAMNWLMIKARKYWFPSPESKYNASLNELRNYKEKLEKGEANFHTRSDNLIPLLMAYEDLLGSCEENLVKTEEDDGSPVSFFKADDYFFYTKGVVSAMGTILEAVMEEFMVTLEARRGIEVLHHAIESCHHASEVDPLIITNSPLNGVFANHRANMAAPLSHARFYIGVLIKTLST
jgi:CBS domain-containing protein